LRTTVWFPSQARRWLEAPRLKAQVRIRTGQAIGILAGAIQPGGEAAGKGLTMIAAQGPIDLQAQAGPAQVDAQTKVTAARCMNPGEIKTP
jgi:hypothetical protein